eukprot:381932_1
MMVCQWLVLKTQKSIVLNLWLNTHKNCFIKYKTIKQYKSKINNKNKNKILLGLLLEKKHGAQPMNVIGKEQQPMNVIGKEQQPMNVIGKQETRLARNVGYGNNYNEYDAINNEYYGSNSYGYNYSMVYVSIIITIILFLCMLLYCVCCSSVIISCLIGYNCGKKK